MQKASQQILDENELTPIPQIKAQYNDAFIEEKENPEQVQQGQSFKRKQNDLTFTSFYKSIDVFRHSIDLSVDLYGNSASQTILGATFSLIFFGMGFAFIILQIILCSRGDADFVSSFNYDRTNINAQNLIQNNMAEINLKQNNIGVFMYILDYSKTANQPQNALSQSLSQVKSNQIIINSQDYQNLLNYVNIEFVQFDESTQTEQSNQGKKCNQNDFGSAQNVWTKYNSLSISLLCPSTMDSVTIKGNDGDSLQKTFSIRISLQNSRPDDFLTYLSTKSFQIFIFSKQIDFSNWMSSQLDSNTQQPIFFQEIKIGNLIYSDTRSLSQISYQNVYIQENQVILQDDMLHFAGRPTQLLYTAATQSQNYQQNKNQYAQNQQNAGQILSIQKIGFSQTGIAYKWRQERCIYFFVLVSGFILFSYWIIKLSIFVFQRHIFKMEALKNLYLARSSDDEILEVPLRKASTIKNNKTITKQQVFSLDQQFDFQALDKFANQQSKRDYLKQQLELELKKHKVINLNSFESFRIFLFSIACSCCKYFVCSPCCTQKQDACYDSNYCCMPLRKLKQLYKLSKDGGNRLDDDMNIFQIVKKVRHLQIMMENSFLKNDSRKFMISHTAQNMINLDLTESEEENDQDQRNLKQADELSDINRIRSRKNTIKNPSKQSRIAEQNNNNQNTQRSRSVSVKQKVEYEGGNNNFQQKNQQNNYNQDIDDRNFEQSEESDQFQYNQGAAPISARSLQKSKSPRISISRKLKQNEASNSLQDQNFTPQKLLQNIKNLIPDDYQNDINSRYNRSLNYKVSSQLKPSFYSNKIPVQNQQESEIDKSLLEQIFYFADNKERIQKILFQQASMLPKTYNITFEKKEAMQQIKKKIKKMAFFLGFKELILVQEKELRRQSMIYQQNMRLSRSAAKDLLPIEENDYNDDVDGSQSYQIDIDDVDDTGQRKVAFQQSPPQSLQKSQFNSQVKPFNRNINAQPSNQEDFESDQQNDDYRYQYDQENNGPRYLESQKNSQIKVINQQWQRPIMYQQN